MASENMTSVGRSIKGLSERVNRIKENFQKSKDMLHGWVAEQKQLMDEEERQISLHEEAIDVENGESADKSVVYASDETSFNKLMAEADRFLLENSEGV